MFIHQSALRCVAMLVVYMREQMSMPVGDIRADQVRRLVFLVGHPTQHRHCKSHTDFYYVRTHLRLRHVFSCGMRPGPAVKYSGTRKNKTKQETFKEERSNAFAKTFHCNSMNFAFPTSFLLSPPHFF